MSITINKYIINYKTKIIYKHNFANYECSFLLLVIGLQSKKTLVPFPPESSAEVPFAIADFPDIASTNTKLAFSSST